jgi:rhodanese-related sulfurtransferase
MKQFALVLCIALTLSGVAHSEPFLLSADTAYLRAQSGGITLIDIRSPAEWHKTGVPSGAIPVTMHDPDGVEAFYAAVLSAVGKDKNSPIALICAAGNRSRWAQAFLAGKGFKNIQNVSEGLFGNNKLPGWLKRGLPTTIHPRQPNKQKN